MSHQISKAVMYPKPKQTYVPILIGGYVDRVLRRAGAAGDGWLTYFYQPQDFTKSWNKVRAAAEAAGKNPDGLMNANQLPIMVGASREAVREEMMAQLKEHIAVGVQKIVFVPYQYRMDQIEIIAREIVPRLKG